MPFYIDISCKPVVKQYIHNKYGNPVVFPNNDWLRCLFLRCLQRHDTEQDHKFGNLHYTQKVSFPILIREYQRFGNSISLTSVRHINSLIQDIINETLYQYLNLHFKPKERQLLHVIENFRKEYNFPEESYSTDAMIKFYQRERARRKKIQKSGAEIVLLKK